MLQALHDVVMLFPAPPTCVRQFSQYHSCFSRTLSLIHAFHVWGTFTLFWSWQGPPHLLTQPGTRPVSVNHTIARACETGDVKRIRQDVVL